MCGVHTQAVTVPAPPPPPAASATFAPRFQITAPDTLPVAGQRGKVRTVADLHVSTNPFISSTE